MYYQCTGKYTTSSNFHPYIENYIHIQKRMYSRTDSKTLNVQQEMRHFLFMSFLSEIFSFIFFVLSLFFKNPAPFKTPTKVVPFKSFASTMADKFEYRYISSALKFAWKAYIECRPIGQRKYKSFEEVKTNRRQLKRTLQLAHKVKKYFLIYTLNVYTHVTVTNF